MKSVSIKEFRPTIYFLLRFIGIYIVGNLLYGLYITAYEPASDPCTNWVTQQSAAVLNLVGYETTAIDHVGRPHVLLQHEGVTIVSVFEGCNGVNVAIIFVAFLISFGLQSRQLLWFLPLGVIIIHLSNILRIILLYWVVIYLPDFMYFAHKYLFTAFIYLVVFLLWIWWTRRTAILKENA